jgi:hypothetical protein
MANTFAPNGFQQFQGTGTTPSYEQTALAIASGNTTPIFTGDPVVPATNTTGVGTGYITQAGQPITGTAGASGTLAIVNSVATFTYTTATAAAPIGSTVVISGVATSGATSINGAFTVTSSTTTSFTFNTSGAPFASATITSGAVFTIYTPVAGVFVGCKYLSTSQKRTVWSSYWPGADASSDAYAYCITDPNAQFLVQTGNSNTTATAVGFSAIGQNIGFNYNDSATTSPAETNGNTATGQSTYFADQYTLVGATSTTTVQNAYLPFRIIALYNYQPGQTSPLISVNGADPTAAYNKIVVGFNYATPNRPGAGI